MLRRRIAIYLGLFLLLALVICPHPALAQDSFGCQTLELIPPPPQHPPKSPVDITQVELLSNTAQDANLLTYLGRLIDSISRSLRLRLPESVAKGEGGTVVIRIQLQKDGSLSKDGLSVACTSGIKDMDAAAQSAIRGGSPFEPLPQTYGWPDLVLKLRIAYRSYQNVPSNPSRRT